MVLIINLNTTIDKTHLVENYALNKVFRPLTTIKVGGGKGVNVARVLNKLKISNMVLGFLGGVNEKFILQSFKLEKINFISVPIKGESRDITLIIDPQRRTETVVNENGPMIQKAELTLFLKKFNQLIKRVNYLALCGSMPLGVPEDFYGQLIKIAKENQVFTILDTSGLALTRSLDFKPDLIKPNIEEMKLIFRNHHYFLINEIKQLYQQGIKNIIVTLGKKGCIGYYGQNYYRIKPPKLKKLSTIGSGDAFTAGLIYSFIKENRFYEALIFATACAAANTMKIGAGELNLSAVNKIYQQMVLTYHKY